MKRILARLLLALLVLLALVLAGLYLAGTGRFGEHEAPGEVTARARPASEVAGSVAKIEAAADALGVRDPKQILFGDLHVHTTISFDAFMMNLPLVQGEGSHPPADACDFARFCSALDFWSINDHAGGITPRAWRETIDSIRQCNEVAGDPDNPDTVAFLGWEWTQVGQTPAEHFGHKNVILRHTDEDRITPRPIAAKSIYDLIQATTPGPIIRGALAVASGDARIHDLAVYLSERDIPECDLSAALGELEPDCIVTAETPADLFATLDAWGQEAIVIPHGTTWGFYTPPGSDWAKQLQGDMHDPKRQTLFEIYSGHGDSEVYRDWRAVLESADGPLCPAPSPAYLPTCWRAGEIVLERCLDEGEEPAQCEARAKQARNYAAEARGQAHLTVPGYDPSEWLDAGQCRDCDEPAFNYRPMGAAQYVMALGGFEPGDVSDDGDPRRFRFGFMASSDNHYARPGTGYKEVHRRGFTESNRSRARGTGAVVGIPEEEPTSLPRRSDAEASGLRGFQLFEMERQASFFLTGGLVAAHSAGRDRESVWEALERREVYGTSGPRILLWFELLNPPGSRGQGAVMGSEVEMRDTPIFQARAVGSFEQKPGCPEYATASLTPERLEHVCKGECYNPGDRRRLITRIEVIRVWPQQFADEPIAPLIDDPWLSYECLPDPEGCVVTFSDPDYTRDGRDTLYYVRAVEEPRPAINAGGVRCELDAEGNCEKVNLCPGEAGLADDCLSSHEPRAWSSPIFVDWQP